MTLQHHEVQVRRRGTTGFPWMVLCEHAECYRPSSVTGINYPIGWIEQPSAMRAACRHIAVRHLLPRGSGQAEMT